MDILSRKLEDTHDEIQRVRGEVVEALKAFYGGASSLSVDEAMSIAARWSTPPQKAVLPHASDVSNASDIGQRVDRLAQVLQDVVSQLQLDDSSTSVQTRLIHSFAQRERLKRQIEQSHRMLVVVEKITHLDNVLFNIDARMDKGNIIGAAEACVSAQQLFSVLDELRPSAAIVASDNNDIVRVLQLQLLKKKNRLLHVLEQAHSKILIAKRGSLRTRQPYFHGSATSLGSPDADAYATLWRASELMGILPARLKDLAKTISASLLMPLFESDDAFVKVSQEVGYNVLTVVTPSGEVSTKRSEIDSIDHKCTQVVAVLHFLHSEMLAPNVDMVRRVTEFVWKSPGILESQLLALLQEKIPKETSAINVYRESIARLVHSLSDSLASLGFTVPSNSLVRVFGDQINLLYAKRRRQHILASARDFMARDYRNSTKVTAATERCNIDASIGSGKKDGSKGKMTAAGGLPSKEADSGSFQMPDYRITHCAHDVVELAHQTLMEACTPDSISANTLFHTSRDVLFLFRAVVPTLYQNEIANDASTCMLFHNDCMYIAHHMLTIGHHYKNRLPPPLSQIATMVDMVPAIRETGERALTAYARTVSEELRSGLRTFLDHGGFETLAALDELEQFIKSALYKLNHIRTSWCDGLPQPVYEQVLRRILQPFAASFLEQMLMEKRVGASTTGKLHTLGSLLLETHSMFASVTQAEERVPELAKLRRFIALLVQPMATIQDQFLNGGLADFSLKELSSIARSIFRDSPERKEFLRLLAVSPTSNTH